MPLTQVQAGMLDTTAQYYSFKNRIINGAMVIDQRNAGASITAIDSYAVDRWLYEASQTLKFVLQQNAGAVTPPVGFTNYYGATSQSSYSVGASDFFLIGQRIEGFNVADLGWGTANAATVTLSFWVRSSLTGTFGGALVNAASNRSYPFTYTITAANTWELETITIPGDTSGTWVTNNSIGIRLRIGLGVGSTFSGTAGAWAAGNFISATGATSVVGTSGATFYITGVQLEKGSTATSFDYRPYGTELALCQRYYFRFDGGTGLQAVASGSIYGVTTTARVYLKFPTTMRSSPTLSFVGLVCSGGSNDNSVSAIATQLSGIDSSLIDFTVAAGTIGQGKIVYVANGSYGTYYIQGTSEL